MVSDTDHVRFALHGPHIAQELDFGDGPVFMVTPLRYISVATIIREAKRRQNGVPDYLKGSK